MKGLKHLFNFYLNSSIHVALSVYALTWITLIKFEIDYDKSVLYFVFYARSIYVSPPGEPGP